MWQKEILTIIIVLFILSSFGQNNKEENNNLAETFLNKRNQHSLSLEFASLSYTYVHKFKTKFNLGVRFQAGLRAKYSIDCWGCKDAYGLDVFELQILYRLPISHKFYFDMGPKIAFIYFPEKYDGLSYGVQASAFYTFWKMHIGIRLDYNIFFYYGDMSKSHLYAVPFVIGFNF